MGRNPLSQSDASRNAGGIGHAGIAGDFGDCKALMIGVGFRLKAMPWRAEDAERHTREASTDTKRRQWAKVANSVLRRGGSEGSAVRQANSVVRGRKYPKKRHGRKGHRKTRRSR